MSTKLKKIGIIILAFVMTFALLPGGVQAASETTELPLAIVNLYTGLIRNSYLVTTENGFMRVVSEEDKILIEYYDKDFDLKKRKSLKLELPVWGGFYRGEDGSNYLVEGKRNADCVDKTEVLRIIKYDSSWNRLGAGKILAKNDWDYEIRYPFDHGCVNMTEVDGCLYVATGREGYVDPEYNQGHQGMMLIRMDEATFETTIVDADFWHSFAQYIDHKGSDVYLYEQSEGSRATFLSKYDTKTKERTASFSVFGYGGTHDSAWSIPCYATVDDFAVSGKNALGLGSSIDQSKYDKFSYAKTPYNLYLTVTPLASFSEKSTSVIWLTSYKTPHSFQNIHLTKINDNRFLVSWEEETDNMKLTSLNDTLSGHKLRYQFIDGAGKKIGSVHTVDAASSGCEPILADGNVVYYAADTTCVNFYTIDGTSGKLSKKVYRTFGDNITWNVKGSTMTISGSGDKIPFAAYYTFDNKVKKIVIEGDIPKIGQNAFAGLNSLKTVLIGEGVTTIGTNAFAYNTNLKKIAIPKSVKKIGKNALGFGDNVNATIYTPKGSYAQKYAKKHHLKYVNTGITLSKTSAKLKAGKKLTLKAKVNTPGSSKVKWSSSDESVATVTSKGKVVAKGAGTATVTVATTDGLYKASCKVKVAGSAKKEKAENPLKVKVSKKTYKQKELKKAASFKIGASGAEGKVSYKLSAQAKKAKLKVNAKGKVTVPKKCAKGTYKITVTAKGNGDYKAGKVVVKIVVK